MGDNGKNVIIDVNTFNHSNHFRILIFYTGHFDKFMLQFVCDPIKFHGTYYIAYTVGGVMSIKQAHAAENNREIH